MKPIYRVYLQTVKHWEELKKLEFTDPTKKELMLIMTIDTLLDLLERALGL